MPTGVDFDHGLNTAFTKIRTALGDDADNPRFVETMPRRGYRFIAPVDSQPQPGIVPVRSSRIQWVIIASLVSVAALAMAGYLYFHRVPKLTDKDTVVLSDFDNKTGDPVFDGTLRQGLEVQLQQSPFLSLISEERVRQTLRLMNQPADVQLTPEIARQICQHTGSAAVLDGSIANLGSQYVLGIKAVNCRTGDLFAEDQVAAEGKEQGLPLSGSADSMATFMTPSPAIHSATSRRSRVIVPQWFVLLCTRPFVRFAGNLRRSISRQTTARNDESWHAELPTSGDGGHEKKKTATDMKHFSLKHVSDILSINL